MKLKRDTKFGEVSTHHFKIDIRNMTKFDPSTRKSKKKFILMDSFWAKYILFELKIYRGTIFHETEEGFKIWRGIKLSFQNWHKVTRALESLKNFHFNGVLMSKVYIVWVKNLQRNNHETEEGFKIWRGIELSFQNWHKEFDKIWPKHSKVSKIFILMGSFWAKYILFELKKYREIIFHETEEGYKIWRVIDFSFQNWH